MKMIFKIGVVLGLFAISLTGYAGKIAYRDGSNNVGCNVVQSHPQVRARMGMIADHSRTMYTLTCSGQTLSTVTMPSIVCPLRAGADSCYRPSLVECHRGVCVSKVDRIENANYEYNYNLPGTDVMFGTISAKSAANVFAERPLSNNYIAYSADGILDKPIILVEGYDPGDNTYPNYYHDYGFKDLVFAGRDLIVVNFTDGADRLEANAALLQKIIIEINGAKTGSHPTAVIGYSMGGLVARIALKNMEVANINHQTSIYVSFDAPHMGANSPVALENTIESLIDKLDGATAGYTSSSLKRAREIYNSPAARQMLIAAPEFRSTKSQDFPERLARVAVTSGSLLGTNGIQANSVYEGEHVASFKFYLYESWLGTLSRSFDWYSEKRGNLYLDNMPGSFEQQFRVAYVELKNGADSFSEYTPAKPQNVTFVPTASALAMNVVPTSDLRGMFRTKSPFDKYIAVDEGSGLDHCQTFSMQTANGKNLIHRPVFESFHHGQLMQIRCALSEYHRQGYSLPSRTHKQY